jgi:repressor LexA
MGQLTENSQKVLAFVSKFQSENGFSPSIPEIINGTGIKSNRGVSIQLDKLQGLGFIHRDKNARRAIKILSNPLTRVTETARIPVVGQIRAGQPIYAEQQIEEYRDVSITDIHGRTDAFLLRVIGDSMTRAGFNQGDLAIVVPESVPSNGDIVVAFFPDEETATLKRFKRMDNYIVLMPESYNPIYKPIITQEVSIQGKVLGKLTN